MSPSLTFSALCAHVYACVQMEGAGAAYNYSYIFKYIIIGASSSFTFVEKRYLRTKKKEANTQPCRRGVSAHLISASD